MTAMRITVAVMMALAIVSTVAHADEPPPSVKAPVLLQDAMPTYPAQALTDRVHAVVVVSIEISETGVVTSATVGSSTLIPETGAPRPDDGYYGFGPAAVEAAKKLVFAPAESNGKPFAVQIDFTYRFALPPKPPEATPPPKPPSPAIVNFKGKLIERGTRTNVPGAIVTVYRGAGADAQGFEATTRPDGSFQFYDLPDGKWSVRVERDGYITISTNETFSAKEVVEARYWIEKGTYSPYDVTVEAERPRKEVNRRSLDANAIAKVPGPVNDPVLVVENLPSVARTLTGDIVVRGSGPQDTGVFIDGIGVPLIYHFGGLKSVVPGNVIGGLDFYPGNYSTAYGRAMGGILDLQLKRLEPKHFGGALDLSILDTSLYLEMPLSDTAAIAVAARRSYIDFLLGALVPDDAGVGLTNAPRYYDFQVLGNWRPKRAHEIRWLALGSDDLLKLLFDDPADPTGVATSNELSTRSSFGRGILDYRYTPNTRFSNTLRLAGGWDKTSLSALGSRGIDTERTSFQLRDNASWTLGAHAAIDFGVDATLSWLSSTIHLPPLTSEGQPGRTTSDDVLSTTIEQHGVLDAAPFIEGRFTFGKLSLVPGLRLDYFGLTKDVSIDPRITARYELRTDLTLKAGAAVVHQAPGLIDVDPVIGNPGLSLQSARQYSAGVEWRPTSMLKIDATLFYKDMRSLVSATDAVTERDGVTVPLRYDNGGRGRVYGAELFIEHSFSHNFRGWLSYTLSRAERRDSGTTTWRRFDYDQPHILAVVGSYALPRHWEIGARLRVVSGNPDTPVVDATFDSTSDEYVPTYGAVNSDRLPLFFQLDLRVDKTFVFDTWKLAAYLSLVNTTNHTNVEGRTYSFDYARVGSLSGLPLLPVFGLRAEW